MAVTEGASALLLPSHLHVITAYYEDKIKDYLVVDPPVFGRLQSSSTSRSGKGRQLNIFSVDDLEQRTVQVSQSRGCGGDCDGLKREGWSEFSEVQLVQT